MHYQISRNGQTYGPYTLEDLRRYLATGNVLPTDLTKSDEMPDWLPVSQVLDASPASAMPFGAPAAGDAITPGFTAVGSAPGYANPALANSVYPDPPNLHWALVLVFGVLCNVFLFVWLFVQAGWMRRVQPSSQAMMYYIGATVALVLALGVNIVSKAPFLAGALLLAYLVLLIVGHFSLRASLEQHYNGPEPIGLQLSGVMTFFFNTIYFQYHFNRINEAKMSARYLTPRGL